MKKIQKYIFITGFLSSILYLTVGDGYTALHSLRELPSTFMESGVSGVTEGGVLDMVQEKEIYEKDNRDDITLFPVLDDHTVLGASYIVERRSRLSSNIDNTIITSDLLEKTMIRNAENNMIDTDEFQIRESSIDHHLLAKRKLLRDRQFSAKTQGEPHLMTFEFGISDTHLIFSEPVLLSVDAKNIPEGALVDLYVLHAGDNDFNTTGLMTDPHGTCLTDGSASSPASQARVKDGKVSFYTCGASTFALGYVPFIALPNSTVWSLATQSDGRVILGGQFTTVGGVAYGGVARVSDSGSLDTSFTNPNVNNTVYATAVQSDGKILIGGAFTGVTGSGRNYLARLNTDGTLDPLFNANITFLAGNQVRTIALQADGKILIGGVFTNIGGVARNRIARLNTDGTLDVTYNPNSNNTIYRLTLQSDGRVLVGGAFTTIAGTARNRIARLSTTGAIDATFNPNASSTVWDIKILSDSSIVLGGQFTTLGGVARNRIAKVSSTGGLITSFNPNSNNTIYTLSQDSLDNVYIGGSFTTMGGVARNRVAKISSTGGLITSFNPNAGSTVYSIITRQDGTLAVGGLFTTMTAIANMYLSYLNPIGTIDSTYNLGINGTVWSLATQSDGRVILGGQFTTVGGVAYGRVARVSDSGSLDTSFTNPNVNNTVYATAVQSDGKILIGGAFTGVTGSGRNYLARLNTDGTLDPLFNANITFLAGNQVRTIALQADGKILIGGVFTNIGGVARNRIARLNTDGTLDVTYNPNSNNTIYRLTLQSDGRVLVGGAFTTIAGTARNRIARLSTTGAIDATFNPNASSTVWDIKILSDSSIVLGGQFTTLGGVARNRIAKVSSTGGLITSFNPNSNNTIYTLSQDSLDNVYIGGSFTTMGGVARNRVAKISSTGGLDGSINPNSNNTIYALQRDSENNLILGGSFTTLSGKAVRYFSWLGLYDGDITPPQILSNSMTSGSLLPIGNFAITIAYTDTGGGILSSGISATLQKWSGATWESDIVSLYLSGTPNITTSTGIYTFSGVPFGKYRYRLYVPDIWGNTQVAETTFYIDAIEWEMDTDVVDIGNILPGIQKNSSPDDELVITVRTVGAGFTLSMSGTSFSSGVLNIPHWDGLTGYGYEQYAAGYLGNLSNFGGSVSLASQPQIINTLGEKNTYTYRVQYGTLVDMMQASGDYRGTANFTLNLTY